MNYGLIYKIGFADIDSNLFNVEIEKAGYIGGYRELTGADSPFTIDIEDDPFLYTPTRFSTARIRVVGSDYLQELYSTAYQQYRVTLKKNNRMMWCGFIKPEMYTQDYSSPVFEFEIECMSAMSSLEFVAYSQIDIQKRQFVTLWDLLTRCVMESKGQYSAVYIPRVYAINALNYGGMTNVLEYLKVSEQNFFDEEDKAMTWKEILTELCKFLNWTCADWKGELYFVDIDHKGDYYKYKGDFSGYSMATFNELNVQNIGFIGSNHSLDILGGYNKVIVRNSNYNAGEMFPKEDYDELDYLLETLDKSTITLSKSYNYNGKITYKRCKKIFLDSKIFRLLKYRSTDDGQTWQEISESEIKDVEDANSIVGAWTVKRCNYNERVETDGYIADITNYNYEEMIQIRRTQKRDETSGYTMNEMLPVLLYQPHGLVAAFADGALCINCSIQLSDHINMPYYEEDINTYPYYGDDALVAKLSIGDYFWNGDEWTKTESTFRMLYSSQEAQTGRFVNLTNTKTLSMPYDGLDGYIIPLPDRNPITGKITMYLYPTHSSSYVKGFFIKNLNIKYQLKDGLKKKSDTSNSDRIYENVVNEDYIHALDEIEFKISSYNDDGLCYGKVMLNDDYLRDNLYSIIEKKMIRLEEQLIRRIINRYSSTQMKLTQIIKIREDLTPSTRLSDSYLNNKKFIAVGGNIDYKKNEHKCIMVEI